MASSTPVRPASGVDDANARLTACSVSIGLYVIACFLPALITRTPHGGGDSATNGAFLLLIGWTGVVSGNFGWLANPLLLVALFMLGLRRNQKAFWFGGTACILGLSSIATMHAYNSDVQGTAIGFYVWMASLLIVPVAALFLRKPPSR
ncbi:hypothetical protein COCOR_03757 [Corallococcus coralloides DSM 2259]|uniref:Uncharacterized protein n=1 Tax=Corallococcus coralloides (strain ATCC 25202 / DSM 2259 / NBRC 100086 / M2) TaxID=1144275 RepID=H8MPU4_CORCM|nr:hypothetical protein [Corallococcus coralloides]AFE05416.1 hypothetical protein COCOR_03757 [Corallococcus coralloides DSM 2259]